MTVNGLVTTIFVRRPQRARSRHCVANNAAGVGPGEGADAKATAAAPPTMRRQSGPIRGKAVYQCRERNPWQTGDLPQFRRLRRIVSPLLRVRSLPGD
jgi:hypothetical protein